MFDFGANWQAFSEKRVNPERLKAAAISLQSLLQRDSLVGLTFLDVGSGLFSITDSFYTTFEQLMRERSAASR